MGEQRLKITRIDARQGDARGALRQLRERLSLRGDVLSQAGRQRTIAVFGEALTPSQVVERICGDVQSEGLSAVLRYGRWLDQAELSSETIRVSPAELAAAHAQVDAGFLAAIRRIRAHIRAFQTAILHQDVALSPAVGVTLRQRYLPLERVGICIPGGAAAYPSTLLMTAVPAQVAGVRELAVVAPPTPFGAFNHDLLATCHELGIAEVYRVGGAQGVAALAYGIEGLARVDKIVGPGNLFVALAKKHVFGHVDIDSIAGPSEIVVIADERTRPDFAAADLLAQAEHAPGASMLISWSEETLERTLIELERQLDQLPRASLARQSLTDFGALIGVRDAQQACDVTNLIAPEHVHIATDDPEGLLPGILHAGAIFLGQYTPVALGDYVAGPSHVLPTSGTARWASGLSSNDFLRAGSVIQYTQEALSQVADLVRVMAEKEELTGHRSSVDVRADKRR
jgi:histidinol dehydrogenase